MIASFTCLLIAWLSFSPAHADTGYAWIEQNGDAFCCAKSFSPCETECSATSGCVGDCARLGDCLRGCLAKHCLSPLRAPASKIPCPKRAEVIGPDDTDEVSILAPGRVKYELYYRGETSVQIHVRGQVYPGIKPEKGKEHLVLKRTETHVITKDAPAIFWMEITKEEFAEWIKKHGRIAIGFTYKEKDLVGTKENWIQNIGTNDYLIKEVFFDRAKPDEKKK